MARSENGEARRAIEQAAFDLFAEVGYAKTSYSAIAERCGITKALVQYYFRKKEELALGLLTRLLEESIDGLGLRGSDAPEAGRFGELWRIGTAYFDRMLCLAPSGYRTFLQDVLASRELTGDVLAFNVGWACSYLGRDAASLGSDASDDVIMSMGGFYELLYHALREGRPFDTARYLRRVVADFMRALGYGEAAVTKALRG